MKLLLKKGVLKLPLYGLHEGGGINCRTTLAGFCLAYFVKQEFAQLFLKGVRVMPYLITRSWYPLHVAGEPGKIYLKAMEKYPPDESIAKAIVPVAVTSTKKGLQTLSVSEVENEKIGAAIDRAARMMLEFRNIEGFSYEIKVWSKVEEALDMIGLGG